MKMNVQVDITLDMVMKFIDEQLNTMPLHMMKTAIESKLKQLNNVELQKRENENFWLDL